MRIGKAEAGRGGWRSWFLLVRGDPLAVGAQQCTLPLGGRLPAGAARHDCAFARASSFSVIRAAGVPAAVCQYGCPAMRRDSSCRRRR
jgi:hypothetical protein